MIILNKFLQYTLQILLYTFPITFIFGNPAINLFIVLISIAGIAYYKSNLIKWDERFVFLSFVSFFIIVFVSSVLEFYLDGKNPDFLKSILFFRYFILMLVVKSMVTNSHLKLNFFINSCLVISIFVALDIFIQFIFGKNFFGYEPISWPTNIFYYSGIFKTDLIAGGYLLMFSTIGLFGIPLLIQRDKKILLYLIFISSAVFFVCSIILSGNRMPLLMFLFFLFILSIIQINKKIKINSIIFVLFLFFSVSTLILKSENIKKRFGNFYAGIPNPITILKEVKNNYPELDKYKNSGKRSYNLDEIRQNYDYNILPFYTGHIQLYITSIDLFLDNPILGKGIRSYRHYCHEKIHMPNRLCQSHPHNFVLEILNDVGIIGLIIFLAPVLRLLLINYKKYKFFYYNTGSISHWIFLAIVLTLIIHLFPFKSTGSFFSTLNAAYTFLLIGILSGLSEIGKNNN